MTLVHNSYLFLRRLIVLNYSGSIAYDEVFRQGVNIIRGKNSSGKSTISNLIFFALGGDFTNWNAESLRCNDVFAEVEINDAIYTLRRNISTNPRQPMSIYWGDYETSKMNLGEWKTYSYSQSEDRVSFSNIIFNALSFPEVRNEQDSNLTMHQVLRLLFIDQDSPTQNLFRFESFDHHLIRQAISELLLGIYDDSLYNDRISLKKKTKEHDEKEKELLSQTKVLIRSGNPSSMSELDKQIEQAENELKKVGEEIDKLRTQPTIRIAINSNLRIEELQKELIVQKDKLTRISNSIHEQDLDILDSKDFIQMLERRIQEINKSIVVRQSLGQIHLEYCPECLTPLDKHINDGDCFLCKHTLSKDESRTHAKRLRQELELQVKESKTLLIKKEENFSTLKGLLPEIKSELVRTQRNLDNAIGLSQSTRDDRIDAFLITKGGIEKEIQLLIEQAKGLEHLAHLKAEVARLAGEISALQLSINEKEAIQNRNKSAAMEVVNKFALFLLRNDLDRQSEFKHPKHLEIDFANDRVSLDGNFNFSASSNVYLKNAARFALFFASLSTKFMRFPRFILCDNMEDKGMEKERTQHFQRLIVKLSGINRKIPHQIIFSTSMIADELDKDSYCVGPFYNQNNKTLKI